MPGTQISAKQPGSRGSAVFADQAKIRRLIARRHPDIAAAYDEWCFLKQAADGGPAYVEGNLFRHPKEDAAVFARRKERAADNHYNLTGLVLDTYQGYLFQREPTADSGNPECVTEFLEHADVERRPAVEFAKDIAYWMGGQGITWVCVDKKPLPLAEDQKPDEEPRALTAAEEKDAGLRPYVYQVFATDVLDGKIKDGVIQWLLIQERERDDEDPFDSTGEVVTRFRLWTPDEWVLFTPIKKVDANGNPVAVAESAREYTVTSGPNGVGRVPFVPFRYYGSEGDFACPAMVADVAHLDRGIFNKASLLDEILFQVTFPQLCIPYAGSLFDETTGALTGQGKQILTMGLQSVIPFASDAGPPVYLVPASGPADTISGIMGGAVKLALSLALLDGDTGTPDAGGAKAAASGVSKAWTFEKLNKRLAAIATTLESGFRQVLELVCLWQDESPDALPDNPWDWPENFEIRSLAQEIADMAALMAGNPPSETFKVELWKRMVAKALPKLDEKTLKKIIDEIEVAVNEAAAMGAVLNTINTALPPGAPVPTPPKEGEEAPKPAVAKEKKPAPAKAAAAKAPAVKDGG